MARPVRKANTRDVDASYAVLADAFSDYEWTRWTVDADHHRSRIESLQRLVLERVVLPYGEAWIAEDDDGLVASVALWMLPDSSIPTAVADEVATAQAALEGTRHAASLLAEAAAASLRPAAPHFYLGAVGTRSERRGLGLASAALAPMLERAEAEGRSAYLETSAPGNVRFYTALGFTVTGEIDVPGGGPHVWAMTRG